MRLGLLTATFLPEIGGAQICVDQLARQFQQSGHEVTIIAPHAEGPGTGLIGDYPVVRYHRPLSQNGSYSSLKTQLATLARRQQFDLLNVHLTYPGGYVARWLACGTGLPFVITPHGGDIFYRSRFRSRPRIWNRIQNALSSADGVIALSSYFARLIQEIAPSQSKIARIPNGVNLQEYTAPVEWRDDLASRCGPQYILALGRLVGRKGFDVAIRAFHQVRRQCPDWKLVFAGDGPDRLILEELAKTLGCADRVVFLGTITGRDKVALLQNCQYTIVPSVEEDNMPLVVLEAMACGRPVLGSQLGGIPDFVHPGKTGELATPGDVGQLARGMLRMLDSGFIQEEGAAARQLADQHDWSVISSHYLALFESILANRRQLCRAA